MTETQAALEEYPASVRQRFTAFHGSNPQVFAEFTRLALQMQSTGRRKYSARTIVEVMRWHHDLKTNGDVFELNNDFTPIYVRLLVQLHPELLGFFELRHVRSVGHKSDEQLAREGG